MDEGTPRRVHDEKEESGPTPVWDMGQNRDFAAELALH
jgi:hypothetical protein